MKESTPPLTIFVAEDEELISRLYRIQLTRAGHSVIIADDGLSAVARLRELPTAPDLLLLDRGLPGLDGIGVYEEAVALFGPLPTIFCSGDGGDDRSFERVLRNPQAAVLTKPVSVKTILETLDRLLA